MKPQGFTAAWLVAAALLASWAVSSASNERPGVAPADVPRALPQAALALEAEVERLARPRHLAPAAVRAAQRDPFTFGRRYTGAAPRVATAPAAANVEVVAGLAEAPAPPAEPMPALAGIAELAARGVVAVISYAGDLHYVSRGDVIAGRYRVDAIAAHGVEVFDLLLGTNSRLILQRP